MAEKRPWGEEEDKCLRFVYETSKLTKWSHIARQLADYGYKGRNGKHCKERYTTHINPNQLKEDWSYAQEQRMFELHNELGNKWAIIGKQLGGKSDNCVKNHFYSKLRKALKKVNKEVQTQHRKDLKQFKPSVLYRIVEVAEDKFKLTVIFEKDFTKFANQLKNELIQLSYQDEDSDQEEGEGRSGKEKQLIQQLNQFSINYKKKHKRDRAEQKVDLLTPKRYHSKKQHPSQCSQSDNSEILASSEASFNEDLSDDEISRSKSQNSRKRRNSGASMQQYAPTSMRTRTHSQGNLNSHHSILSEQANNQKGESRSQAGQKQVQGMLGQLNILQEEQLFMPHPLLMKKQTSNYSRKSQNQQQQYSHFFDDSEIQLRIIPEIGLRRESQIQENIFN